MDDVATITLNSSERLLQSESLVVALFMFFISLLLAAIIFLYVDNRRIYKLSEQWLRTIRELKIALEAANNVRRSD